jgi:ubiquitin C-terminal hydrolase
MTEKENCEKCHRVDRIDNYNWILHLDITNGNSLEELVNASMAPKHTPTKTCGSCGTSLSYLAVPEFQYIPPILILHLGRFADNGEKSGKYIDIPLALELKDASGHPQKFELRGIVDHIGTSGAGHYIAKCWCSNAEVWFLFDDTHVSHICINELVTANTYVVSYAKVN